MRPLVGSATCTSWPRAYFQSTYGIRYDHALHAIRTRVRLLGARLVQSWVRVRYEIRAAAAELLARWRANSTHLLGVHLRGTDKVRYHLGLPDVLWGARNQLCLV